MSSEVGADHPRHPARIKNERRALEYRFGDTQHPPLLAAGVLASLHVRLSQPEGNRPSRRIGLLGRYSVRQPVPHFEAGYGSVADTVKLPEQSHHAFFEDEVCQMGFPALAGPALALALGAPNGGGSQQKKRHRRPESGLEFLEFSGRPTVLPMHRDRGR